MDHAVILREEANGVDFLEFVAQMEVRELLEGLRIGNGLAGSDKRQIENLDNRKAAGGIGGQRPDDVGDTHPGLVEELLGTAAQLHRGKAVNLDPALGFRLDLASPRRDELGWYIAVPRQEVVELQPEFSILREAGSGHEWRSQHAAHANQNAPTRTAQPFPHKQDP